jgi:hypothetical protein
VRELAKSLAAPANFLTTPQRRAKQNHLFRTNRIIEFSPRAFPPRIPPRKGRDELIAAASALTQIASATPAESALPFLLDLKSIVISTHKKRRGYATELHNNAVVKRQKGARRERLFPKRLPTGCAFRATRSQELRGDKEVAGLIWLERWGCPRESWAFRTRPSPRCARRP